MNAITSNRRVTEKQRLAVLHSLGLLDSPAEPAFDRLTRLVTRLLGVPISLVSIIDTDRQFFKSSVGLPEPWATRRETPLSYSFCQYVVETGEPLVAENTSNHALLCTVPALPYLDARAYLGIPLITNDGIALGSLCAMDYVPRKWSDDDIELVRDLAAAVITEIELRRDVIARMQAEKALHESDARFAGAFHHASIGIALVASNGQWLQVNQALCALIGYSEQELLATTFQQLTHPDDLRKDLAYVSQMLRGKIATYQMEKRYFHKDGHILWVVLNVSLVRDLQGTPQYFVAQLQDVTQRHHHEQERQYLIEQLREAVNERDSLLQQSQSSLYRTDALYHIAETLNRTQEMGAIFQAVVENAARVLPAHRIVLITVDNEAQTVTHQIEGGPGAQQIPPLSFSELSQGLSGVVLRDHLPVISLGDRVDARESLAVQQRRRRDHAGSIIVVPIQSQEAIVGTLTAINAIEDREFTTDDLNLLCSLANQAAVAIERAMLLGELEERASTDGLTRLLNRRTWLEHSQRLVAIAERQNHPLSVVVLDADYFKRINDTYGHETGDQVLVAISQILQQMTRRGDVVGRYGGEEFVILLPETDSTTALQVAERIRATIASHSIEIHKQFLAVTVSQGIATAQGLHIKLSELLKRADAALYKAKQAGRNCVHLAAS